eukprot:gene9743-7618_t
MADATEETKVTSPQANPFAALGGSASGGAFGGNGFGAANPFAALGSAASGGAFGGNGFGAGGIAPTALFGAPPAAEGAEDGDGDEKAVEEECQAEFKPLVQLEEVETSTGEEEEECLLDLKCKLYRYDAENNEWKERVMPGTTLQEHAGSDKAWVWSAVDFSEGQQKIEMFCIRFGSVEKAQEFKAKFEDVMAINEPLITAPATAEPDETEAEVDKLADEITEKAAV